MGELTTDMLGWNFRSQVRMQDLCGTDPELGKCED